MEDIVQEALTKGVEMHKAGEFEFAGQLYGSVIKLHPTNADANHNMGLLKADTGHDLEALPYLQTALCADTSVAQFWLSYIKALLKINRFDEAASILNLAEKNGVGDDKLFEFRRMLNEKNITLQIDKRESAALHELNQQIFDTHRLDQALRLAKQASRRGSLKEAKRLYQNILEKFPGNKRARQGCVQ